MAISLTSKALPRFVSFIGLALCTASSAGAVQGGLPPQFKVRSLEPFGSAATAASALNDAGQVTGVTFREVGGQLRAFPFVWSSRTGIREPVLFSGITGASAEDINQQGEVTGFITHPLFGTRGYRWRTQSQLGSPASFQLFPALQNRVPLAISDNGRTIAGQGYSAQDPAWVFDTVTNQVTDLIVGGQVVVGINEATAINGAGHVVGTISTLLPSGIVQPRAFRYIPGFAGWFLELLPGVTTDWESTRAFDINDSGEIVGTIFDAIDESVAHWNAAATFTDLGVAPSEFVTWAKAVNEDGWIVGWSPNDHPSGLDTPMLWFEGAFYDLNDLTCGFGDIVDGFDIEDTGVIYRAHDVNAGGVILAEIVHFSPALRFEDVLLIPVD